MLATANLLIIHTKPKKKYSTNNVNVSLFRSIGFGWRRREEDKGPKGDAHGGIEGAR